MKKLTITALVLIGLGHSEANAWGLTGHRVVAEIAEQHLTRKTKRKLNKIIGTQKLAYWANWSDFIKSEPTYKFADSYHYVNIEGNLPEKEFLVALENTSQDQLYHKALFFINELKSNRNLTLEQKKEYLYFLIHMIGDAHQPLHVGREEDLGGNKIKVEWFRESTNIHTIWDTKLIDFDKYSYTEYTTLLNIQPKKVNAQLTEGWLENWLFDSYQAANKIYSTVKMDDKLSYRYHYDNKYIVEQQLLKGGLRLAKVLNFIYH